MTSINIFTDLAGKVRNMPHFYNKNALLPLFEAVVNSIQSIEDSPNKEKGCVLIRIIRDENPELIKIENVDDNAEESVRGAKPLPDIIAFEVIDNGLGFNEENYKSFLTSDSTLKIQKGCKGLGRFSWLKAFDNVEIESKYIEKSSIFYRKLEFNAKDGIREFLNEDISTDCLVDPSSLETKVRLIGFNQKYRESSTSYKKADKIAQRILEHCLAYFISGNRTDIKIEDGDETISISELYEELSSNITTETFSIKEITFKLHHIKMYKTHQKANNIFYCANARDVLCENIERKIGISASDMIDSLEHKFIYAVYVESKYLDENVSIDRLTFEIPKENDILYSVSMNEIEEQVVKSIKSNLSDIISRVNKAKEAKVEEYVSNTNPALRAVLKYAPNVLDEITLSDTANEEKLSEILYKNKAKMDCVIQRKGKELLKTQANSLAEINENFGDYKEQLEDVAKDALADYVSQRKRIIDLFAKKLELIDDKYEKERAIHDIIMPQNRTTNEIPYENNNLWLIDERLVFHNFAVSDRKYRKYTNSKLDDRPDIFILQECDNEKIAREISIVELKRPQRQKINYDEMLTQIYGYPEKIKGKDIKLENGRDFNVNDSTRFYIYFICDFNEDVDSFATRQQLHKLPGGFGYYMYHQILKLHINLINYDRIVVDAEKRNFAFFEKLGLVKKRI